jgi:hypothetical protein
MNDYQKHVTVKTRREKKRGTTQNDGGIKILQEKDGWA